MRFLPVIALLAVSNAAPPAEAGGLVEQGSAGKIKVGAKCRNPKEKHVNEATSLCCDVSKGKYSNEACFEITSHWYPWDRCEKFHKCCINMWEAEDPKGKEEFPCGRD
ncbi:hypothetical protein AAL_07331 [Moelleriella libera RCEF 2490]|uniref:Uncharacterized protein n=1 Tax=Moelleriella libera RCEF 2490 TaxID=1081109 RepID=A0A166NIG0_9HYPO|nr:hypothetical protein AAL_07331 [Moelleriella libera RCEF 2490]